MSKNIHTPRSELVCGKIEALDEVIRSLKNVSDEIKVDIVYALRDIQYDCQRMEAKLISRKNEAKEATAKQPPAT